MNPIILPVGMVIIFLQIFLSRKPRKWLGMILPCLSLLISIFVCVCFMVVVPIGKQYCLETTNGNTYTFKTEAEFNKFKNEVKSNTIASEYIVNNNHENMTVLTYVLTVLKFFFAINIITLLLYFIYHYNNKYRIINQNKKLEMTHG